MNVLDGCTRQSFCISPELQVESGVFIGGPRSKLTPKNKATLNMIFNV